MLCNGYLFYLRTTCHTGTSHKSTASGFLNPPVQQIHSTPIQESICGIALTDSKTDFSDFQSRLKTLLFSQATWLPSPRSEAQAFVCLPVWSARVSVLQHSIMLQRLFFIAECGIMHFLCAIRVFELRESFSPPGVNVLNFVSLATSIAELAHEEKSHHSISQLIWCPENWSGKGLCLHSHLSPAQAHLFEYEQSVFDKLLAVAM